jgi:hypothetical protein
MPWSVQLLQNNISLVRQTSYNTQRGESIYFLADVAIPAKMNNVLEESEKKLKSKVLNMKYKIKECWILTVIPFQRLLA